MTGFDLSTISAVYVGDTPYSEIYLGSTKIWPSTQHDYSRDYFTIQSLEDNNDILFTLNGADGITDISVSTDNGVTWTTKSSSTSSTLLATLNTGDKLLVKGSNATYNTPTNGYHYFSSTKTFNVYGNIMSLIYEDNFVGQTSLTETNTFHKFFYENNKLINAENLILPATTLAQSCYNSMFKGCTSLTTAPTSLPATTLARSCYDEMFNGCTSLTIAPELPATTLTYGCYWYMFAGCTSLTTAPTLPATTLATYCYWGMFQGCTSLTTAPTLPATTTELSCYEGMFNGCTSLTTAPVLPATILSPNCYDSMFAGCTSLTTAPASLPATTLAVCCYYHMFYNCTSLTTAPTLPAYTLASNCYDSMFKGCTSLTTAPTLPAYFLVYDCYYRMFNGCTSLNSVTCHAIDISASSCLFEWLDNVAATGDFYKDANTTYPTGASGIPSGWTIHNIS